MGNIQRKQKPNSKHHNDMNTLPDSGACPYKFTDSHGDITHILGLSKRELFAAMAMQGLLANPHPQVQSLSHQDTAMVARDAADALISRLNESPK